MMTEMNGRWTSSGCVYSNGSRFPRAPPSLPLTALLVHLTIKRPKKGAPKALGRPWGPDPSTEINKEGLGWMRPLHRPCQRRHLPPRRSKYDPGAKPPPGAQRATGYFGEE